MSYPRYLSCFLPHPNLRDKLSGVLLHFILCSNFFSFSKQYKRTDQLTFSLCGTKKRILVRLAFRLFSPRKGMCCHLSKVPRTTKYWKIQRILNDHFCLISKLIVWVGIIWTLKHQTSAIKSACYYSGGNCIIIKNWSYKSVFNWCYPPNLFAYYLISESNVGDPVWVLPGLLG